MGKPKIKFLNIQIINGALIIGVILFLVIATTFIVEQPFFTYNDQSVFKFIVPSLIVFGFLGSTFLFKTLLQKINKEDKLQSKLGKYQSATIVRAALLEAPALVSIVAFIDSSNYYYLIFAGVALLLMITNFPTKDKFTQQVDLNFEEKNELRDNY